MGFGFVLCDLAVSFIVMHNAHEIMKYICGRHWRLCDDLASWRRYAMGSRVGIERVTSTVRDKTLYVIPLQYTRTLRCPNFDKYQNFSFASSYPSSNMYTVQTQVCYDRGFTLSIKYRNGRCVEWQTMTDTYINRIAYSAFQRPRSHTARVTL